MKALFTIFLCSFFSISLFSQNRKVSFRFNSNIEKASSDFLRMDEFITEKNSKGFGNSSSLYKLKTFNGDISNWGGAGISFNLSGSLSKRWRINVGMGYHLKIIKFDFYEDYKISSPTFLTPAIARRIEYHFDEKYLLSNFQFPLTLSLELIPNRLRILSGFHLYYFYNENTIIKNRRRAYSPDLAEDIYDLPLGKVFVEKREFIRWQRYLVIGIDWQLGEHMSIEMQFRQPFKKVVILPIGTISLKPSFGLALNYWLDLPNK